MGPRQVAWTVVQRGHDVLGSDGEKLGTVKEVVGDREGDIFSGITYSPGLTHPDLFIPADAISEITVDAVHVALDRETAQDLDAYEG